MALTQVDGGLLNPTNAQYTGFKNRIINGSMAIDQRNAGASGTADGYTVDRWQFYATPASRKGTWQQNAGSVTPPAGFKNYWGFTSNSAYTVGASEQFQIATYIEGYNVADLGWGAAGASPVTLSFWVRSSLTGTFGGCLANSGVSRSYPFAYTINAANTWEYKTLTIQGDTTGTWLTTNGNGLQVNFCMGAGSALSGTAGSWSGSSYFSATGATSVVGTNGATFYITGVQLEKGSTATSFDYRPYGTELALCQRYYYGNTVTSDTMFTFLNGNNVCGTANFPVFMRSAPTVTVYYNTTPNVIAQVGYGNHAVTGIGGITQKSFRTINGTTFSSSPYGFYEFNFTASAEL